MTEQADGFGGYYYDGRSAGRRAVRAEARDGRLTLAGEGIAADFALGEVRLERSVSGDRYTLRLPGGAQVRTSDVAAVLAAFGAAAAGDAWLRRFESRWRFAAAALALIALAGGWAWAYGLPMLSRHIAQRTPLQVQQELGEQSLAALDATLCRESRLTRERHEHIRRVTVQRLVAGRPDWGRFQLEFRDCRAIGPNAFALPDALFVMTDDLARLAADDDELAAVMAHEIGHAQHRHALRMSLQAAGVAIIVSTLASDAVSITALAAGLPTLLMNSGYSRAFEDEADRFALARLAEAGIPVDSFARILERLAAAHRERHGKEAESDYLSTHPSSEARIERARTFRP